MLTIRQAQLTVFSQLEVEKFEKWMLAHLKKFFPSRCREAGDGRLLDTIRYGIERAAGFGITARRDVCKYIDLTMVFGRDFEGDERYPWAGEILASQASAAQKVERLHEAAHRQLRRS